MKKEALAAHLFSLDRPQLIDIAVRVVPNTDLAGYPANNFAWPGRILDIRLDVRIKINYILMKKGDGF